MMFQSGEDWLNGVDDEYSTHSHPSALEKRKGMNLYGLICFYCKSEIGSDSFYFHCCKFQEILHPQTQTLCSF